MIVDQTNLCSAQERGEYQRYEYKHATQNYNREL